VSATQCPEGESDTFLFVLELLEWNLANNLTQESFTQLLGILRVRFQNMFPGDTLPANFDQALKHLKAFGLPANHVDMCVNGCCRFDGVNKACTVCPSCKESRWDPEMMEKPLEKRRGRTSFYYWDMPDLLRRMYAHPELNVDMQAHSRHVPCDLENGDAMRTIWGAYCPKIVRN